MGHIRIGAALPATRPWKEVVGLVTEGAHVAQVAESTANASELAFSKVQNDAGFREAVWLLTQVAIAGSKPDTTAHLKSIGVDLEGASSAIEVALAIGTEMDARIDGTRQRSDFGEMAQRALITALTEYLDRKLPTLIPSHPEDVTAALRKMRSPAVFSDVARTFFGKLTNEYLEYFLSKTLATHVGENRVFASTEQLANFESAMAVHCHEAAAIVEDFSGDWFSKHRYEGGGDITRHETECFGWFALEKIRKEVTARARRDEK